MMVRFDKKTPGHTGQLLFALVFAIFAIALSVSLLGGGEGDIAQTSDSNEAPVAEDELQDASTEGSPVNLNAWEQVASKEKQSADADEMPQQASFEFGTPKQAHATDSFAELEAQEAEERYRASVNVVQGTVVFTLRDWREEGAAAVYLDDASELARQCGLTDVEMILETKSKTAGEREGLEAYDVYYQATASAESKDDVWDLVDKLAACDEVVNAEPDFVWETQAVAQPTLAEFKTSRSWSDALDIESVWSSVTDDYAGKAPGEGVVVAVIDTGVDYTHPDLDDSMWVNEGEIPGNGIDDDFNGYVDDVYGIDLIEDDCDPMDDHGHGTHVAGIIAMEANGQGGVGVAYGAKVMAIKAGQPTGSFASTDIAKAVKYAADNGADIINMSFGGAGNSSLVEAALEDAFGSCVLVASAGNKSEHTFDLDTFTGEDIYPAAYQYVVGVMASYADGSLVTPFSNWDINPQQLGEYELVAPGVGIYSTLPGGRYAAWSGTSMAAPIVAATAAVVRMEHPNKAVYTSRYIAGQLISATQRRSIKKTKDGSIYVYPFLSPMESLTLQPKPMLTFDDIVLFDSTDISEQNNGDQIVQAGETIDFGIVLRNRWGSAKDVVLTADATSEGGVDNPHVELLQDTVDYQDMGTFMTANNDLVYDDGLMVGASKPIRVRVSEDAPNDLQVRINFHVTARNGLDEADDAVYKEDSSYTFVVQKGEKIEGTLTEDRVLSNSRYWIINSDLYVPSGITLTIEPGTQLQVNKYARIYVGGRLIAAGTEDNPIEFDTTEADYADERFITIRDDPNKEGFINDDNYDDAYVELRYVMGATNLCCATIIDHCKFVRGCYKLLANTISYSSFDSVANINSGYPPYGDTEESYFYYGPTNILCNRFDDGYIHASTFNATNNILKQYSSVYVHQTDSLLHNNAILSTTHRVQGRTEETTDGSSPFTLDVSNNYWGTQNTSLIDDIILDKKDWMFADELVYNPILSLSSPELETIYPFVTEAYVTDMDDNLLDVVAGGQAIRLHVKFNRDMASTVQPLVTFGGTEPYTDYVVTGDWEGAREWVGNIVITPFINQGTQYIRVKDATAADDTWLLTGTDAARFSFTITTNSTASMTLQGAGAAGCNELAWTQDDYDTLAGYNLYRSTDYDPSVSLDDQTFERINSSLIVAGEDDSATTIVEYKDSDVEVGTDYAYYFTVVDTAFNESEPSNVVTCTPLDGEAPVIEHQPLESISLGSTGIIIATVTDNVSVSNVSLHYRMADADDWSTSDMRNTTGNIYRVVIAAYELGAGELEYWIEASDGINTSTCGTADDPMHVAVNDPNAQKDISTGSISPIPQQTYTGQPLEPSVEVVVDGTTLVLGTDYDLAFSDNVDVGTATVAVTGRGNYAGTLTAAFEIAEAPKTDISPATFSAVGPRTYDGTAQEPEVALALGGDELVQGVDYELAYSDNVDAGTATITATGKGAYDGVATCGFDIIPADIADVSFSDIDAQPYTGLPLEPKLDAKLGDTAFVLGTDYDLTYADNVNAGTATVATTGKGNLKGTRELTFVIEPADLSHATMGEIPNQTYTGMVYEPEVSLTMFETSLLAGTDYDVSYENNVNAGTAIVMLEGKGNFTGTKRATFGILPVSLDQAAFEGGEDQIYTGVPAETSISLTYGEMRLEKGVDYDVSYACNDAIGWATATITGKGNYTGSLYINFEVLEPTKTDIAGAKVAALASQTYCGTAIEPDADVTFDSVMLVKDVDYEVSYADNVNVGTASVVLTGIGSYTGSLKVTFEIVPKDIASAEVLNITGESYTGHAIEPAITVAMGETSLVEGTDYSVVFRDNVDAGTATVTVAGRGNYTGEKNATFAIAPADITQAAVEDIAAQTYTGGPVEPTVLVMLGKKILAAGTDYDLAYTGNVGPGTATVTVTGRGNYAGDLSAAFEIVEAPKTDISSATFSAIGPCVYDGTAQEPEVALTLDGVELVPGVDYDLSYAGNVNAGTASITATGKGSYSGTATCSFAIVPADMSGAAFSPVADQFVTGEPLSPTVTVMLGGDQLTEGVDYMLEYADNVSVGTATITAHGQGNYDGFARTTFRIVEEPKTSIQTAVIELPECVYDGSAQMPEATVTLDGTPLAKDVDYTLAYRDNVNAGTATVIASGMGGYDGEASATFEIRAADLAQATVAPIDSQIETGSAIEPEPVVTWCDGQLVSGADYTVAYADNAAVGTATVILTGTGNFVGELRATFEIAPAPKVDISVATLSGLSNLSPQVYTGKPIVPTVSVSLDGQQLVADVDYTVSYANNTDAGTATVTVTGMGGYTGTKEATFAIAPAPISAATIAKVADQAYQGGNAVKPAPKVTWGGKTLKAGTDYTVSYKNNAKENAQATVTVTGKGNFAGTKSATFKIVYRKPTWSGATSMPQASTATFSVTNGGYIRLKSGGKWVKSDAYVSISGKTVTAKRKSGSTTVYLLDSRGRQVASKRVSVFKPSGNYEFQSLISSKLVLDIRGAKKDAGARMLVWERKTGSNLNQQYQLHLQPDGTYAIRCAHSKLWLEVKGSSKEIRGQVVQSKWTGKANQRWQVRVNADNSVTFVNVNSGMVFDVQGGKAKKGAFIIQWESNGGNNQKWKLVTKK